MNLKGREKHFLLGALEEGKIIDVLKENHAIIAGGALRAVFNDKPIKDYDLYFTKFSHMNTVLNDFKSDPEIEKIVETETAVTFKKGDIVLQVIKKMELIVPDMETLIAMFDYTVCMAAYDIANDILCMDDDFLKHNCQKRLVFNPATKYPIASLIRMQKYVNKYGYKISGIELAKIGLSINKLRIETYADLKNQLLGIDTLFLKDLTDKLDSEEMAYKKYEFDQFMYILEEHIEKYYGNMFDVE